MRSRQYAGMVVSVPARFRCGHRNRCSSGGQGNGHRPAAIDRREDRRPEEARRLLPSLLERTLRPALDGSAALRHRGAAQHGIRLRSRLQRHRHRSRRPLGLAHRRVRARGPEGADGGAQPAVPRGRRGRGRDAHGEGRVRALGAVGLPGGRRDLRARARRRHRVPRARRREHRAAPEAGQLPPRPDAQLDLPADDAELPEEHRDGGRAHVRRPAGCGRPCRGGGTGGPPSVGAGGAFFEGVRSVAASAEAATIRVHHSLAELPDGNYKPRAWDPRSGYMDVSFKDYSAPLGTRSTSVTWPGTGCRRRTRRPPSATR